MDSLFQKAALIIVAAGSGTRFGGWKQLADLSGKPLLVCTAEAFKDLPFSERVVVVPAAWLGTKGKWHELENDYPILKRCRPVAGGADRAHSVRLGIEATSDTSEFVAIHDGARPFPPLAAIAHCLKLLHQDQLLAGAIVASPVTDSIKRLAGVTTPELINHSVDRQNLCRAETPQIIRRQILLSALSSDKASGFTDEASALEALGLPCAVVRHDEFNLKVTHAGDILLADAVLKVKRCSPSKTREIIN